MRKALDTNFLDPKYLEESLISFHNAPGLHLEAINTVNHIVKRKINSLEEIDATRVQQQQIRQEIEERKRRHLSSFNTPGELADFLTKV